MACAALGNTRQALKLGLDAAIDSLAETSFQSIPSNQSARKTHRCDSLQALLPSKPGDKKSGTCLLVTGIGPRENVIANETKNGWRPCHSFFAGHDRYRSGLQNEFCGKMERKGLSFEFCETSHAAGSESRSEVESSSESEGQFKFGRNQILIEIEIAIDAEIPAEGENSAKRF